MELIRHKAGTGFATELPDFDFETFSEAGYNFREDLNKWVSISKTAPHGLGAVGAPVYAEHPSTEVLSLAYNLKDGLGPRLWVPGMAPPEDLFAHIQAGGLLEAHNSAFEFYIWRHVCRDRMGWPDLPYWQLRDSMAKCRAHSLPGALGKVADVLDVKDKKIGDGARLIKKFSCIKQPSKKDPRRRILVPGDPDEGNLYDYNLGDIAAESAISKLVPDLSDSELVLWLCDQAINFRGCAIDLESLAACKSIIEQATEKYTAELVSITWGVVSTASEIQKITGWLGANGCHMPGLTADEVELALTRDDITPAARRVLEIRSILGAASVKKVFALDRRINSDGRIRDLFSFCGADRTGRWAGMGPQPQNLPASGPEVRLCECSRHFAAELDGCPWCGKHHNGEDPVEWNIDAVEDALEAIFSGSLDVVEAIFVDPIHAVAGCLRGLFAAAPGHDLLCSDYSAIEAVCLAELAGEQWRIDVFNTHGKIYEMSAAKITGIPFEEFIAHKEATGEHHPARKKIGKVAELASGYQGSVGAWRAFGADEHFETEEEILAAVRQWRKESPAIVDFWYRIEEAAVAAVQYPGSAFEFRGLTFGMVEDVLYCRLLSGRKLAYHSPRVTPGFNDWGRPVDNLTYMGWNSDYKKGPKGWMRLDTYGGKLTENITQATARDILAHAIPKLEAAGYPVVLHVHDETVSEVPEGTGTIEEYEAILGDLPEWCAHWPVKAAGGWRGKRYRKD